MSRIKKIKDWKENKPQFEFIEVPEKGQILVRRIRDGVIFMTDFPYVYKDGIQTPDGSKTETRFLYILTFNSDQINLNYRTTTSISHFGGISGCEINQLKYIKSGTLETIGF